MDACSRQPPGKAQRCCWAGWKEGLNTQPPGASGFSFRGLGLSAEPCDKALAVTVHWHLRLVLAWGSSWVLAAHPAACNLWLSALALLSTGLWPPGRATAVDQKPRLGPGPATTNCVTLGRCVASVRWTVVPGRWRFLTKSVSLGEERGNIRWRLLCLQERGAGKMEGWASCPGGVQLVGTRASVPCSIPLDGETEAQPSLSTLGLGSIPALSRRPSAQQPATPVQLEQRLGSCGAPALPLRFSPDCPLFRPPSPHPLSGWLQSPI